MDAIKSTVLIVDDDVDNLEVVGAAMKKAGHKVLQAVDLEQARKILKRTVPDVIILDRNLPDGDGIEFCIEIRDDADHGDVPILFLSVRDSTQEKVLGLDHGADDYLPKPFGVKELQARVVALLRRAGRGPKSKPD